MSYLHNELHVHVWSDGSKFFLK